MDPLHAIALVIGGVVGWLTKQLHVRAQIRNLKIDSVVKAGQLLATMQASRQAWSDACAQMSDCLRTLIEAMRNQRGDCRTDREALCDAFAEGVVPKFRDFVEQTQQMYHDRPDQIAHFLSSDVLSELRRWRKWLDAINSTEAMAAVGGGGPLRLHRPTLECYLRYVDTLPPSMREIRPHMLKAIEELLREAQASQ